MYCKFIELCGVQCNTASPEKCIKYKEIERGPKVKPKSVDVVINMYNGETYRESMDIIEGDCESAIGQALNYMADRGDHYIRIGNGVYNLNYITAIKVLQSASK